MDLHIADIRKEYKKNELSLKTVISDPFKQFEKWLQEAIEAKVEEPTAMIVGTATPEGRPSTRTVLLKGLENDQFIFYTNYNSRKGQHLQANPFASLTFFWPALERQVHVEGEVKFVETAVSDQYFQSRPYKSRLGARISPQSQIISSRNDIKVAFAAEAAKFIGRDIPRPDFWGGFAVYPSRFEFWQGRESRLHDRILFELKDKAWQKHRLAP
ncbi:MAG: pyridoxamine 5'-phosphate oxidase [Cyclobacteriaceae bacterium]|nr:pyridoxamine 5'-phosphate oxidase [Cyclobacteriaceae bacterium]